MSFHSLFHCLIRRLYYSRITVIGTENIPHGGSLLVLCLHRNGAVDGCVYPAAIPRIVFLVRAKLREGLIGRLYFPGVDVPRCNDGVNTEEARSMIVNCFHRLQVGATLGIFPEGTSDLGSRHLPFRSGAARITSKCLEDKVPFTVLPMGIHYECPWAFRSRVEIVIGKPISLDSSELAASGTLLKHEINRRFTTALEDVGINVQDEVTQDLLGKFAYTATLRTKHGYFNALKSMEEQLPSEVVAAWYSFEDSVQGKLVLRHQGVPLFPTQTPLTTTILTVLLGVPVLIGVTLNVFPIVAAWYSGRHFSDGRNVIALWRILIGVPLFLLWAIVWAVTSIATGNAWLGLIYFSLTIITVAGWYRLKILAVTSWNGLVHGKLRNEVFAVHQLILDQLER